MSGRRAKRQRREAATAAERRVPTGRLPTLSRPVTAQGSEPTEAQRIAADTEVVGRALPAGHPALTAEDDATPRQAEGEPTAEAARDADEVTGPGHPVRPAPVLLCEPRRTLMVTDGDGAATELQIEIIVQAGFGGRVATPASAVDDAPGWTLSRADGGLELRDDEDGLWARAEITAAPEWLAAASSSGQVVVLYGFRLGVVPPDVHLANPGQTYTDALRAAELRESCAGGWVAGARVAWRS
ncbi:MULTISPECIES: hypothetical protein [Actinoalloteichus]|uniref:Uncharacterized protein n=1 Tax=Actinoalloteichus fjordicus TaxID=1612552 RepID=A0AAC9PT89_9PSEU|nr:MULTISPECIES: hypothetical protein [Actinoalloteichus]APU15621.1 hypothetical protein UA74_17965 [Actinoalloteichus fjordicus]APU21681.1 hypothetical protein UA75_18455 [Actinoalloteichus sp. GBA129-24]